MKICISLFAFLYIKKSTSEPVKREIRKNKKYYDIKERKKEERIKKKRENNSNFLDHRKTRLHQYLYISFANFFYISIL